MTYARWWAPAALALLAVPAGRAAEDQAIRRAIDRGVAYLKQLQGPDGTWSYTGTALPGEQGGMNTGATALAGLALLECGVPADDAHVRKAADVVRAATPQLTYTYALALSILFLDRLGDPADEELIDSLAVRLLAGQSATSGGWTYDCPPLAAEEAARLRTLVAHHNELVAHQQPPRAPKGQRAVGDLPKAIQAQLRQINQAGLGTGPAGDNSNTQFAIMGLWVARRQGIPVEAALARIDQRFRLSQGPDGGWGYEAAVGSPMPLPPGVMAPGPSSSTPTMTCAGLLGLALSHGAAFEVSQRGARKPGRPGLATGTRPDPGKDAAVRRGLLALGSCIGRPPGAAPPGAPPGMAAPMPRLTEQANGRGYYFLWSLERAAVAYGLSTIGDKDWYDWAADVLLANQAGDGSWQGEYGAGGCDTSFALLFLRRANLAPDLTALLKGRVTDPGVRELRAGGVGGEGLKGIGLKPAFETGAGSTAGRAPAVRGPDKGPGDAVDAQAVRLAGELVSAEGGRQKELLDRLRDSKGGVYTEALALAIPKLAGAAKAQARDALADRLTRMTAATLADKLRDDDAEVRRAAALACAMKEERSHIPRLIELLSDPEPPVAHAAHAALKSLTSQDFGPEPDATRADIAQAALRWQDWWRQNGGK